jgi:hypothetical protein
MNFVTLSKTYHGLCDCGLYSTAVCGILYLYQNCPKGYFILWKINFQLTKTWTCNAKVLYLVLAFFNKIWHLSRCLLEKNVRPGHSGGVGKSLALPFSGLRFCLDKTKIRVNWVTSAVSLVIRMMQVSAYWTLSSGKMCFFSNYSCLSYPSHFLRSRWCIQPQFFHSRLGVGAGRLC